VQPIGKLSGFLAAAVVLSACSGPSGSSDGGDSGVPPIADAGVDAGLDGGPDAGPALKLCGAAGSPCSGGTCCGNLDCQQGVCTEISGPACAGYGEPCDALPCCVTPPPPGGWPAGTVPPIPGCRTLDGGPSVCYIGTQPGDPCGAGLWGCTDGLACISGSCALPSTNQACPRDGGLCLPGDDCTDFGNQVYGGSAAADPCQNSGLDCEEVLPLGNTLPFAAGTFLCFEPEVVSPPDFPLAAEDFSQYSVCSPQSDCAPVPGDTAAVGCGSFFIEGEQGNAVVGYPVPVCVELCQSPDECGSLAWDCLGAAGGSQGQCLPNYCYAETDSSGDDIATALGNAQGTPVSSDISVLFQPCSHGGPNTVCLPQNDNNWNTTTGICYRVGPPDAGGVGASCDPTGARTDLGGLCAAGTLCFKGTCLPWCDTGNRTVASCQTGQDCVAVGGSLVSSTANDNGTGVCTESCNPYLDAGWNSCPVVDGGPPLVCKPAGTDNDFFPSPGVCVGGSSASLALGQPCSPFGWVDPCPSGAVCAPAGDAGTAFVCSQVCDPQPSPGIDEPACPTGATCTRLGPPWCVNYNNASIDYACYHVGVCL